MRSGRPADRSRRQGECQTATAGRGPGGADPGPESLSSTCFASLLRWLWSSPVPGCRLRVGGAKGQAYRRWDVMTLGRGDPGNSKGWSQTPKYPTPKLQFTHDLGGGGGGLQGAEKKENILIA
ncbi:hypothetical protein NN561_011389 [Cricetulus griseus]